jgi:integrase
MSVRPRGQGWQADVQHQGRRAREQFETRAAAEAWEAEAFAALRRGQQVPKAAHRGPQAGGGGHDTMQALLDVCQRRWSRNKDSAGQAGNAARFVRWVGPELPAREGLAQERISAFMEYRRAEGSADATLNKYSSAIGKLVEEAQAQHRLDAQPKLEWTKGTKKRLRYFSREEDRLIEQTLRTWGYEREADFFAFLVETGMRPWIEARGFRWADVSEGPPRVYLEPNITKNGEARTVPLTTRAWAAVKRQPRHLKGPWEGMNKDSFTTLWRRLRGHLPQIEDTVLYTARHTCASRLVQNGIDLYPVMVWMGHKSITQTQTYAHLAPKQLFDAVAALEAAE